MTTTTSLLLLRRWHTRIKRHQLAHRFAAKGLQAMHIRLGIPTVILSASAGSLVFASFDGELGRIMDIIIGLLSISAAALASMQTFLRFGELSVAHQRADAKFASIRHRIEQIESLSGGNDASYEEFINEIRKKSDRLTHDSPLVQEKYWQKARSTLKLSVVNDHGNADTIKRS